MTIVRIVLADPRTGGPPDGGAVNGQQLIVLADDAGQRAVPLWLPGLDFKLLWLLLDRPAGDAVMAGVLEETAARLLHAAGVAVTVVDIGQAGEDVPELRSGTAAARVGLATAAGTRHVTVSAGYGLKLAVAAGAPVRVADAVMDRLAVPVHGEDVHAPFLLPGQLLHAAGITVTAVTPTDVGPAVTATRVDIAVPGGTRQVTTRLADGLALAVTTGAPLAVDDPVMDRLAEPVTGPDPLSPFRSRQQAPPPEHTRFEPRNLAFTDGLHRWQLDGTFLRQVTGPHDQDYSCTTEDGRVILAAAVPGPAGFAVLRQEIEPDDYRGRAVTFRGHLRTTDVAGRAGLVLRVPRQGR